MLVNKWHVYSLVWTPTKMVGLNASQLTQIKFMKLRLTGLEFIKRNKYYGNKHL